jgi:hypothetical protein
MENAFNCAVQLHRLSRSWLAGLVLMLSSLFMPAVPAANSPRGSMHLSPCALPGVDSARCGSLEVAENPRKPHGRHLSIRVAVIPAKGKPLRDPIAILMGGPGEDAISAAGFYADQFSALRSDRDILLVDQRGTGLSAPLPCQLFSDDDPGASLRDVFPPAAVEKCAGQLRLQADLPSTSRPRCPSQRRRKG